jgi:hypothetical protein
MKRVTLLSIAVFAQLTLACTFSITKVPDGRDTPRSVEKTKVVSEAVAAADPPKVTWKQPGSQIEYIYLGMGTFDDWSSECEKLGPNMRPLTLDVNFSKSVAVELLSAAKGAVFDSEEVNGSEIIEGRMIAYKLASFADKPCESYPRAKDGGRLPAFFVPSTSVQRSELHESDLLRRSYTCKLATRVNFPVPIVCAGQGH